MNFLPATLVENFHFLRPLLLLGLVPAFILFLFLRYLQGTSSNWTRAIDPALLPYLLDRKRGARQSYPLYGLLLLWMLGFIALAGPSWRQIPVPVQEREDAVVLMFDLSMSMYATDMRPDRVTRARRKIMDLLEARRAEGETALVVYAGTAHAVTPLTDDVETIGNLVASLQPSIMPAPGSKPAAGVALALELLAQSSLTEGHLILLTDGIQQSDIAAIDQLLRGTGHRLSVLGFGTEEGAPIPLGQQGFLRDENNAIVIPRLDRALLQSLAADNAGRYADAQISDSDISFLLERSRLEENENLVQAQDREFDTWDDTGPWLVLLALPLAALAFRRGWLLGLLLGLGLSSPPQPAHAVEWQDLWVNKDNQGIEAFEQESFGEAATDFKDPAWRAAANYRNENYEATIADLAAVDTADANYNRGNALAHLQQYEAAIAAYDRALSANPDHADALHNKELVEKLLTQQQQEQQQQQSQGDQEQQDQQQDGQQQQQQQGEQSQQNQQQQGDQQQQQQEGEQSQQDGEQQDQEPKEQEEGEQEQEQESQQEQEQELSQSEQPNSEQQQAMEQWLMRIPDDPGELLRNKFQYQTQQRLLQQLQNPALAQPQPGDPLW